MNEDDRVWGSYDDYKFDPNVEIEGVLLTDAELAELKEQEKNNSSHTPTLPLIS